MNSTRQMQVGIPLMQLEQDSLDENFPMGNKETNKETSPDTTEYIHVQMNTCVNP